MRKGSDKELLLLESNQSITETIYPPYSKTMALDFSKSREKCDGIKDCLLSSKIMAGLCFSLIIS